MDLRKYQQKLIDESRQALSRHKHIIVQSPTGSGKGRRLLAYGKTYKDLVMENNSLFPLKYRLRKTDELVEIVAWETAEKGARSESDWVSYIDSAGVEHVKEHLTLEWDFVIDSPFEKIISGGFESGLDKYDPWDGRRYELTKEFILEQVMDTVQGAVELADEVIAALKKSPEAEEEPKKGL